MKIETRLTPATIAIYTEKLSEALSIVPEITEALTWLNENPSLFIDILEEYLMLLSHIDNLEESHVQIITAADRLRQERNIKKNSASHISMEEFLHAIESSDEILSDLAHQAFSADTLNLDQALQQLATLMSNGHKMFERGGTPMDGDPASDSVIWGHTQFKKDIKPEVATHFIVSHFLSQYFLYALKEHAILKEKDDFFVPLTSAPLLHMVTSSEKLSITEAWSTPRPEGGLGWLTEDRIATYKDAVTKGE